MVIVGLFVFLLMFLEKLLSYEMMSSEASPHFFPLAGLKEGVSSFMVSLVAGLSTLFDLGSSSKN